MTAVFLSALISQNATMAKANGGGLTQNPSSSSTLRLNRSMQEYNEILTITFYDWTDPCNLKFGVANQGLSSVIITSVSVSDLIHEGSGLGLNSTISPGAERLCDRYVWFFRLPPWCTIHAASNYSSRQPPHIPSLYPTSRRHSYMRLEYSPALVLSDKEHQPEWCGTVHHRDFWSTKHRV